MTLAQNSACLRFSCEKIRLLLPTLDMGYPTPRVMDTDLTDKLMALALASVEGFRSLAFAAGGTCEEVGGTICWYSSSHVHLFNGAALLAGSQINPDNVDAIDLYFSRKGRPYCLLTLQELVPAASMQLAHLGYIEAETLPAMWLSGQPHRWRDFSGRARVYLASLHPVIWKHSGRCWHASFSCPAQRWTWCWVIRPWKLTTFTTT